MDGTWSRVSELLRERIGAQNVEMWFEPAVFRGVSEQSAVLQLPNKFFVEWINDHYSEALLETFRAVRSDVAQVLLHANSGPQGELFVKADADALPTLAGMSLDAPRRNVRQSNLIPKYTFGNFVVGASNQFAHAAAQAVATHPGERYNPLFIYGGVGLGKTHLINAIGHSVLNRLPGGKVGYLSAEAFMNELISALRQAGDRMDEFKNRFRKVDVLILDDVHVLAGRERTQEEFFHTFNVLHESRRQIVLTSDKTPKDIRDLEDRLRSRFEWGLIADIQPPDVETRVAILLKKAEGEGLPLPYDVALFLASEFEGNIRELEGSLTRLGAFASLAKKPITVEFAREGLKDLLQDRNKLQVTPEIVQKVVCEQFGIRMVDMKSVRRTKNLAFARQVAMYLSRRLAGSSLTSLGEKFKRDHSTVFHAIEVIEERRKIDSGFQATLAKLERQIENELRL